MESNKSTRCRSSCEVSAIYHEKEKKISQVELLRYRREKIASFKLFLSLTNLIFHTFNDVKSLKTWQKPSIVLKINKIKFE